MGKGLLAGGLGVVLLIGVSPVTGADAGRTNELDVIQGVMRNEQSRLTCVQEFTRLQHYAARNQRFGESAEMLVRMHYNRGKGKTFTVVNRSGSATIQTRVFDRLLRLELESSHKAVDESSLITMGHYSMQLAGRQPCGERSCYLLELKPKERDRRLFAGSAWVDPQDFGVVHIEGRTGASVSFWVGKPFIVQDFQKFGDYWFATRRHSTSDSLLLGDSELTIDYTDYHIVEKSK